MSAYDYVVPDFDFTKCSNSETEETNKIDDFLDIDHEADVFATPQCVFNSDNDLDEKEFLSSPTFSTGTGESSGAQESLENGIRRSMSVGNLQHDDVMLRNAMNYLTVSESGDDSKPTRQNEDGKFWLRPHSIAKSDNDRVRQSRYASQDDIRPKKFISMAEAINTYHRETPPRFHSISKLDNNRLFTGGCNGPMHPTIPQSPALQTKRRARAINVLSWEEKQLKDFEEAQKFKIKANPLNPRVLNTPPVISKSRRPATVPEPFKLTEVQRKSTSASPSFEFRAKPVPKCIKEPLKPLIKTTLCTNPRTPTFLKRAAPIICPKEKEPVKPTYKGGPTKLIPFSFDEKINEMKKKKEKYLNEVLEKEKKAREFHAQPIPKIILNNQGSNLSLNKMQENDKTMMHRSSDSVEAPSFKAKPAIVLVKPPFIPKPSSKPLTEIVSYPKNSIKRATEREKFYEHLREKEEMIKQAKEEREAEKQRLEDEKIAELRRQTAYQAQPIRHYKRVKNVTPKMITNPISPKFSYVKNKENISK